MVAIIQNITIPNNINNSIANSNLHIANRFYKLNKAASSNRITITTSSNNKLQRQGFHYSILI